MDTMPEIVTEPVVIKPEYELRPIPGYPGYFASSTGYIWSYGKHGKGWFLMSGSRDKDGYLKVTLCIGKRELTRRVHILVCLAFHGLPKPGQIVRHFPDKTRDNNVPGNVHWGSHKENSDDMIVHGTIVRGETHSSTTLTDNDIPVIRQRRKAGEMLETIARDYGVCIQTISNIDQRYTWPHIK